MNAGSKRSFGRGGGIVTKPKEASQKTPKSSLQAATLVPNTNEGEVIKVSKQVISDEEMQAYGDFLDRVGTNYIENNEAWNNIEYIEIELVEVYKKLENEKDTAKRRELTTKRDILETQRTALNKKQNEEENKNESNKNTSNVNRTKQNNSITMVSLGKTRKGNKQTVSEDEIMVDEGNTKNISKPNDNNEAKTSTTYAQISSQHQSKVSLNKTDTKAANPIRIRFQFKNKDKVETKGKKVKSLLYEIMLSAKAIEPSISLLPWSQESKEKNLNGYEVQMLPEEKILDYLDDPNDVENFTSGRTYYQMGVRLKSRIAISDFVEEWNRRKYSKETKIEWKPIKAAEMQFSDKAYAIGYFAGTTERGDYKTIAESLKTVEGVPVEISYQFINQPGVTAKIWEDATYEAEKCFPNPNSREHKRVKFKLAPSALTVYVGNASTAIATRRRLVERYGMLKNKQWPVMADGSRMRFIPIVPGSPQNDVMNERLYNHMWMQAHSKAGEVNLGLNVWDIHEKKQHLRGFSMEQVIHGVTSAQKPGIPLFKHITKKWTNSTTNVQYEVAVSPVLVDEATKYLQTMRNTFEKEFDNRVGIHFRNPSNSSNRYTPYRRSAKEREMGYDDEMEAYILTTNNDNEFSKVLIEGMNVVFENDSKSQNTNGLKNLVLSEKSNEQRAENNQNKTIPNMEIDSTTSDNTTRAQNKSQHTVNSRFNIGNADEVMTERQEVNTMMTSKVDVMTTWEEMTIAGETTTNFIPATDAEIRKVKGTIQAKRLTSREIEDWKNRNIDRYEQILNSCGRQEYELLRVLVETVEEDREKRMKATRESEILNKLMTMSENNEESGQYEYSNYWHQRLQMG